MATIGPTTRTPNKIKRIPHKAIHPGLALTHNQGHMSKRFMPFSYGPICTDVQLTPVPLGGCLRLIWRLQKHLNPYVRVRSSSHAGRSSGQRYTTTDPQSEAPHSCHGAWQATKLGSAALPERQDDEPS